MQPITLLSVASAHSIFVRSLTARPYQHPRLLPTMLADFTVVDIEGDPQPLALSVHTTNPATVGRSQRSAVGNHHEIQRRQPPMTTTGFGACGSSTHIDRPTHLKESCNNRRVLQRRQPSVDLVLRARRNTQHQIGQNAIASVGDDTTAIRRLGEPIDIRPEPSSAQ